MSVESPVLLTDVLAARGKAGESGTLTRSQDAIADQSKPVTVVVRVPQGETESETTSNIIDGVVNGRLPTPKGSYTLDEIEHTSSPDRLVLRAQRGFS